MTQIGEAVSVGMIDEDDWECPFEHKKPGNVSNDLESKSKKLGSRLGNGTSTQLWSNASGSIEAKETKDKGLVIKKTDAVPEPHEVDVELGFDSTERYPYSVSAHHLIPGEASLPKSSLINYIKGGKVIASDIGYGVNGAQNGIWLPTHHALSQNMPILPGETEKKAYKTLKNSGDDHAATVVHRYTYTVMEGTGLQFHDDHTDATDYSNFVIKVLNKIQSNLVIIKNYNCEDCQKAKAGGGKLPPPHRLVNRLNLVSYRLSGYLTGNPLSWRPPLFTSQHAESLANDAHQLSVRGKR